MRAGCRATLPNDTPNIPVFLFRSLRSTAALLPGPRNRTGAFDEVVPVPLFETGTDLAGGSASGRWHILGR
jgi:hypothetical protein